MIARIARPGPGSTATSGLSLTIARTAALLTARGETVNARGGSLMPTSSAVRTPTPASRTGPRISVEALTPLRR